MTSWRVILCGLFVVTGVALAHADAKRERSIQSPSHTVALLELYTSEG